MVRIRVRVMNCTWTFEGLQIRKQRMERYAKPQNTHQKHHQEREHLLVHAENHDDQSTEVAKDGEETEESDGHRNR